MRSHYSRLMLTNIKKELNSATNRCRTCSPIGLVTKQNMKSFYNGGTMTLENISCDRWKDCESFVNAKKEKEFVDRTQYITNHQFKKSSAPKNDLLPIHYIRNNRSKSPLQKVRHELSNNTQLEVTTVAKTTLIGEHRKNQIAPTTTVVKTTQTGEPRRNQIAPNTDSKRHSLQLSWINLTLKTLTNTHTHSHRTDP